MTKPPNNPDLIGMLHVPVNTLLASPAAWRSAMGLPALGRGDWRIAQRLPRPELADGARGCPCQEAALTETVGLSFLPALVESVLREASVYTTAGLDALMLENIAAPYSVRGEQAPIIYWVMRMLAEQLRTQYPDLTIGIQILAHSDDWAMDIACRCGLDFVRCESALFEGLRPEGRTPNHGNLAKLYMMRQMLLAELEGDRPEPQVYVDVQKKHTVFPDELSSLDLWLENILFQKLEGVIITGRGTGVPVDEEDLRKARDGIDDVAAKTSSMFGQAWTPQLLVGSGVSVDNLAMCRRYADAVIVGSSLKENGYWECPLDSERLKRFMEVWNA